MSAIAKAIRRVLVLALLSAAVYAIVSWLRGSKDPPPPEPSPPVKDIDREPSPPVDIDREPPPEDAATAWVPPNDDGTAPRSHPIKANASSGIYHVPGGGSYNRTKPERCYATPADAEADGFRPAKR